jgi:hypothetical protein
MKLGCFSVQAALYVRHLNTLSEVAATATGSIKSAMEIAPVKPPSEIGAIPAPRKIRPVL